MLRAFCLLLLLAAPAFAEDGARPPVSDFGLRTLGGEKVKLSGQAGKVVLVSFWATWCNPCKQELAFLDELAAKYADQGLVVLAINTDAPKSQAEVRRFVSARGLKLPVLLDQDGEVANRLNPRAVMPFTIYVDRNGRRAFEHEGFTPDEPAKIEARVAALLKEAAAK
jgi:thiol-disulfide isomerase/thioredoxin